MAHYPLLYTKSLYFFLRQCFIKTQHDFLMTSIEMLVSNLMTWSSLHFPYISNQSTIAAWYWTIGSCSNRLVENFLKPFPQLYPFFSSSLDYSFYKNTFYSLVTGRKNKSGVNPKSLGHSLLKKTMQHCLLTIGATVVHFLGLVACLFLALFLIYISTLYTISLLWDDFL